MCSVCQKSKRFDQFPAGDFEDICKVCLKKAASTPSQPLSKKNLSMLPVTPVTSTKLAAKGKTTTASTKLVGAIAATTASLEEEVK